MNASFKLLFGKPEMFFKILNNLHILYFQLFARYLCVYLTHMREKLQVVLSNKAKIKFLCLYSLNPKT